MRHTCFVFACLWLIASFCAAQGASTAGETKDASSAQTSAASPDAPSGSRPARQSDSATANSGDRKSGNDSQSAGRDSQSGTSNDRLFFTLPNFLTIENAGQVPPLTTGEKFRVVTRSSFDYVQLPWYGFLAGISQAQDSEEGYGQGAAGYGKRLGAYAADGTIENFMVGAILPSIFRQDPRYFQSGHGSFWRRTGYSVSRVVVTRTDSGRSAFNVSEIAGSGIASAISTYSYHPREDRTFGNTMSVWGSQVSYDTITFVVKEFWPDIRRKMKKQHGSQK